MCLQAIHAAVPRPSPRTVSQHPACFTPPTLFIQLLTKSLLWTRHDLSGEGNPSSQDSCEEQEAVCGAEQRGGRPEQDLPEVTSLGSTGWSKRKPLGVWGRADRAQAAASVWPLTVERDPGLFHR